MADSNSKKPMALLLLVVVAVLVVIMVNQGGGFEGFDKLTDEASCTDNGGAWVAKDSETAPAVEAAAATCAIPAVEAVEASDNGTPDDKTDDIAAADAVEAVPAADDWGTTEEDCPAVGADYVFGAAVDAKPAETAPADVCNAPDYTTLDEAGCTKAHGTWVAAEGTDGEADYTAASCTAWSASE